ncbi:MAG TPA: DUF6412 domain-containing protein [Actinocrinis sp.]|jgi:hypothetical protein
MTRRAAANAAGYPAAALTFLAFFAFLAPVGGQHALALTASAAALTLVITGLLRCARVVLAADPAAAARGSVAVRSSSCDAVVLPQRDPDAAGKPRPRAPGSHPSAV